MKQLERERVDFGSQFESPVYHVRGDRMVGAVLAMVACPHLGGVLEAEREELSSFLYLSTEDPNAGMMLPLFRVGLLSLFS